MLEDSKALDSASPQATRGHRTEQLICRKTIYYSHLQSCVKIQQVGVCEALM